MRDDVKAFVALAARVLEMGEPIVEFGALQTPGQEGYAELRTFFPGKSYIGCDVVPGPGVDRIEDLHHLSFGDGSVGSLIFVETLEHVANPYLAVRELRRVLRDGGVAIASTPFNFAIHYMPDYTRFTPEGMARLLSVFGTTAVFSQGDPQHPYAVYGLALKNGDEGGRLRFEAAVTRLQSDWYLGEHRDPLLRFEPLESSVRSDPADRRPGPLVANSHIEQYFTCTRDNLTRIDVRLWLTGAARGGWLTLRLFADDGTELNAAETRTEYVCGERWVAFTFPAVEHSAGRRLRFRLECSDPQSTIAPFTGIPAVEIPGAELVVDGQPLPGTLCFEAFCQRTGLEPPATSEDLSGLCPEPQAGAISATLAAARLQANELHHVASRLQAAIEKLHVDTGARLGHISEELLKAHLRQDAQANELLKLELSQSAQSEQLLRLEMRQERQGVALGRVADFVSALREHKLTRRLARLLRGRRRESITETKRDASGGR